MLFETKYFFKTTVYYKKIVSPEEIFTVESMNGEFMSSILHLLPLIYLMFTFYIFKGP